MEKEVTDKKLELVHNETKPSQAAQNIIEALKNDPALLKELKELLASTDWNYIHHSKFNFD